MLMKSRCSAAGSRVVSAVQYRMSNGGGGIAWRVVVDPVVQDQVVGPEPGEPLGQRPAVEIAAGARGRDRQFRRALVGQRGHGALLHLVEHGNPEIERCELLQAAGVG